MSDSEEKKHKASDRKLRKKREEGSIANSQESIGFSSTAFGIVTTFAVAIPSWHLISSLIVDWNGFMVMPFEDAQLIALNIVTEALFLLIFPVALVVLSTGVVAALIANKGIVFAMKPVIPDLKRISPKSGFKRVFGKRGWLEFFAGLGRLAIWIACVLIISAIFVPTLFQSVECAVRCQGMLAVTPFALLIFVAVVLLLVSAVFEMVIQKSLFLDEQKSTESEKKRESKDQHGSPEIRQERERLRQDQANSSAVPLSADDATILFESEDGLMGIYYYPPDQMIPVVCAKLKAGKEAEDLVKDLKQYGVLVVQNEAVFRNAQTRGIGEALESSVFKEFARALTEAYQR